MAVSDSQGEQETPELEEEQFVHGIINMSKEVRELRKARGRQCYYDMEVKNVGLMAGVQIKYMSTCKQMKHVPIITADNALQDARVEIERGEEIYGGHRREGQRGTSNSDSQTGNTDSCMVDETGNRSMETSGTVHVIKGQNIVTDVETPGKSPGKRTLYECKKCEKLFSRKSMFDRHEQGCQDSRNEKRGDSIGAALTIAHELVYGQNEAGVYNRHCTNPELTKIGLNVNKDCREVRRGWTKRPKWGESIGTNTVSEFKPQIKIWFDIGSAEPGKKCHQH